MAKKPSPATAVADDEVDELETEEEATTEAPAKASLSFGVSNGLIPLLKEKTGKDYTPREVRTLLRKLARQDNPLIDREVVAGNKTRYEWAGPKDPEVLAVLKMVKGGAIETAKTEALAKLKSDKAAKQAQKAAETAADEKKAGKKAPAAPPVDEDEDEDDDD